MRLLGFIIFSFSLNQCVLRSKDNPDAKNETPPREDQTYIVSEDQHVIMVIDDGIDPEHEAYRGRVLKSYTLDCEENQNEEKIDHKAPFETLKKRTLNDMNGKKTVLWGENCKLKEGIELDRYEIPSYLINAREDWNRALKNKDTDKLKKMENIFNGMIRLSNLYHGTFVASIVAYKNPKAALVLVEKKLASETTETEKFAPQDCLDLGKSIKMANRLLKDKEIYSTIIEKGTLSERKILDELAKKHHVNMINKSYGLDTKDVEKYLKRLGCGISLTKDLMQYTALESEIEFEIAKKIGLSYEDHDYLTFQAAGNSSMNINSTFENNNFCTNDKKQIIVGSYSYNTDTFTRSLSYFSNYGKCVDLYAIGEPILSSTPQDFLVLSQGTSFSTPLTIRYISENFDKKLDPLEIRRKLLDSRYSEQEPFLAPGAYAKHAVFNYTEGMNLAEKDAILKFVMPIQERFDNKIRFPSFLTQK